MEFADAFKLASSLMNQLSANMFNSGGSSSYNDFYADRNYTNASMGGYKSKDGSVYSIKDGGLYQTRKDVIMNTSDFYFAVTQQSFLGDFRTMFNGSLLNQEGNQSSSNSRDNLLSDNLSFLDPFKQYIAIVAGESGNNHDEAQGIGEVILRRMELKGADTYFNKPFIDKIGGEGQFDAIGGSIYNSIVKSTWDAILSPTNDYSERIKGAIRAFISPEENVSRGAYFWNACSPEKGFNWKQYQNGTFTTTSTINGTTFFKYVDSKKNWP